MMTYIYELEQWPEFSFDKASLSGILAQVRYQQGRLIGQMEGLGFSLRSEAMLQTLTQDVLKSSEIEGEVLDQDQVRSSIARRLGMDIAGLYPSDRHVDGIVEMMLDATENYSSSLTKDRLYGWHAAMFPTGRSGLAKITVGAWRTDASGPMQVVSGPIGREKVHYQAPDAQCVDEEMSQFLDWLNKESAVDTVIKAGLAHLWFVTIHPFEDGNGRIGRAITDMMLARSEESNQRFYSMSSQIRQERKSYYDRLEKTQKGTLDVTAWLSWYLECLLRAIGQAETTLSGVIAKSKFWEKVGPAAINERQHKVLNQLLDGFEGKLTTSKWAKLTNCSQDTAYRDILDLVERNILVKGPQGGRSTHYVLIN